MCSESEEKAGNEVTINHIVNIKTQTKSINKFLVYGSYMLYILSLLPYYLPMRPFHPPSILRLLVLKYYPVIPQFVVFFETVLQT